MDRKGWRTPKEDIMKMKVRDLRNIVKELRDSGHTFGFDLERILNRAELRLGNASGDTPVFDSRPFSSFAYSRYLPGMLFQFSARASAHRAEDGCVKCASTNSRNIFNGCVQVVDPENTDGFLLEGACVNCWVDGNGSSCSYFEGTRRSRTPRTPRSPMTPTPRANPVRGTPPVTDLGGMVFRVKAGGRNVLLDLSNSPDYQAHREVEEDEEFEGFGDDDEEEFEGFNGDQPFHSQDADPDNN